MTCEITEISMLWFLVLTSVNMNSFITAEVQHGKAVHVNELDNLVFRKYHIIDVQNVSSLVGCTRLCGQYHDCMSFFYHKSYQTCKLHRSSIFARTDGVPMSSFAFYVYGQINCPIHLGFILYNRDLCVYVAINSTYTFAEGQQFCDKKDSKIIPLRTQKRRNIFKDLMALLMENPYLHPLIYQKQFYINLQKTHQGWVWANGVSLSWDDFEWGILQPYCPPFSACNCMTAFQIWDWRWNDITCTESHKLICEYVGPATCGCEYLARGYLILVITWLCRVVAKTSTREPDNPIPTSSQ